jgi:hypothetical protein
MGRSNQAIEQRDTDILFRLRAGFLSAAILQQQLVAQNKK